MHIYISTCWMQDQFEDEQFQEPVDEYANSFYDEGADL